MKGVTHWIILANRLVLLGGSLSSDALSPALHWNGVYCLQCLTNRPAGLCPHCFDAACGDEKARALIPHDAGWKSPVTGIVTQGFGGRMVNAGRELDCKLKTMTNNYCIRFLIGGVRSKSVWPRCGLDEGIVNLSIIHLVKLRHSHFSRLKQLYGAN